MKKIFLIFAILFSFHNSKSSEFALGPAFVGETLYMLNERNYGNKYYHKYISGDIKARLMLGYRF